MTLAFSKILSMFGVFAASKIVRILWMERLFAWPLIHLRLPNAKLMLKYSWKFTIEILSRRNFRKQQIKIESEFN